MCRCCFLHESSCFFQWRQADSIRHLGKVTLAQEQDYTGLVVGCVCVSLLLLLLGTLLLWKRNKHIDGKSRATDSRVLSCLKQNRMKSNRQYVLEMHHNLCIANNNVLCSIPSYIHVACPLTCVHVSLLGFVRPAGCYTEFWGALLNCFALLSNSHLSPNLPLLISCRFTLSLSPPPFYSLLVFALPSTCRSV